MNDLQQRLEDPAGPGLALALHREARRRGLPILHITHDPRGVVAAPDGVEQHGCQPVGSEARQPVPEGC